MTDPGQPGDKKPGARRVLPATLIAEYPLRGSRSGRIGHRRHFRRPLLLDRCIQRGSAQLALFGVSPIEAHAAGGDLVRRAFFVDGYGRDVVAISFIRPRGAPPELVVHVPRGEGGEVPEPMRTEVAAAVPEAAGTTSWGTPSVDVGAGVRAQLVAEQVEVVSVGGCTREREDLHSYRRDGDRSGRMAGIGWLA